MQKIGREKAVYNSIEEVLNPSHTALVLWDALHAFTKMIFNLEEFSRNLNSVVEAARKTNISIFIDIGFERMLRNAGIITVVFTGIATEFGIESSAKDAFNRGFYSVVVSDCVASPYKDNQERSLENMKNLITITNSKELANFWLKH
jgi:nicotinamidase-related amidase